MKELNFTYYRKINNKKFPIKCYAYYVGAFNYNWHEDVECLVVINGKLEACVNGKIYKLSKGDIAFFDSNEGHATLAKDKETIALVFHFNPKILDEFDNNRDRYHWTGASDGSTRNNKYALELRKSLVEIVESFKEESLENKIKRSIATDKILLNSIENFALKEEKDSDDKKTSYRNEVVRNIIAYLDENYRDKISLEDVAEVAGYHPNYTSEIFSKTLGISFTEYLLRKRLSGATKDLKQSEKKIAEIALDHGFPNVRSFNTAFRENFGRSPSEYRQSLDKETLEIDAQFKKVFLSDDNLNWLRAKKDWVYENEENEKKERGLDYKDIEREIYKKIIEDLEKNMNKII